MRNSPPFNPDSKHLFLFESQLLIFHEAQLNYNDKCADNEDDGDCKLQNDQAAAQNPSSSASLHFFSQDVDGLEGRKVKSRITAGSKTCEGRKPDQDDSHNKVKKRCRVDFFSGKIIKNRKRKFDYDQGQEQSTERHSH